MKYADVYAALQAPAEAYYEEHRDEIEREWQEERCGVILRVMPTLANVSVWCRDGRVCRLATHCAKLACPHKASPDDVVRGCASCQMFQVTAASDNWFTSAHLFQFGRVEGSGEV